jgi:TolB-like protein
MKHWVHLACVGLMTLSGAATTGATAGMANPTVAIFPFELLDSSQEGELFLKVRPEETKRLDLLTNELKARLTASGQFQVASMDAMAAEIKAAAPLFKCNGCETVLAKKSGAKLAMFGLVQKFSDTLLAVNIQVIDAETGVLKNAYSSGVQGNTDDAWVRGVSYIVRNRLLSEISPK